MGTLKDAAGPAKADDRPKDDLVRVEVVRAGSPKAELMDLPGKGDLVAAIREALRLEPDDLLFERDQEEPLEALPPGRRALRLVIGKVRKLTVRVNYEHQTAEREFGPGKTVFKVLQWAVGKKPFDLDATASARANLILPGADEPLPREAVIGQYAQPGQTVLVLDLTLKDFTNGC